MILRKPQGVVHAGHEVHEDVPASDDYPEPRPLVSFVLFVDAPPALTLTLSRRERGRGTQNSGH